MLTQLVFWSFVLAAIPLFGGVVQAMALNTAGDDRNGRFRRG